MNIILLFVLLYCIKYDIVVEIIELPELTRILLSFRETS